jgi:hypothetical protein
MTGCIIKKLPVPTKRDIIIVIESKLCNALLLLLLVIILSYLKLVMNLINILFWIDVIRTLYIYVSKNVRIPGYYSRAKGIREKKTFRKHWSWLLRQLNYDPHIATRM